MNNKSSSDIKPYIRQFYRGNIGYLMLTVLRTILNTAALMAISWLLQQIIDLVSGAEVAFTLLELVLIGVASLAVMMMGCAVSYFSEPRFISKASLQYKNYVFSRLSEKGISAFSGENTSVYVSALSNDVKAIETGYLSNIFLIIDQVACFIGALALMIYYDPLLTLISVCVAILPLLASLLTGGVLEKAEKRVSDRNESYMSTLRDALSGFSVIKAFKSERQMQKIFESEARELDASKENREKSS